MRRLQAMAGLWRGETGYTARAWRLDETGAFSPSGVPLIRTADDPVAGANAVLTALDLSRELSNTPWSSTEAEADWLRFRTQGPRSLAAEMRIDVDDRGEVTAWMLRLDARSNEVRTATRRCELSAERLAETVSELLQGEGDPPASDIDIDLALRTLYRWFAGDWSDSQAAAALDASAARLRSVGLGSELAAVARAISHGPRDEAESQAGALYSRLETTFIG